MSVREIPGVQDPVVKHARKTGWLAWKMKIEGRNGHPDFHFYKNGVLLIVEFKALGKPRNAQQERRAKELLKQGFVVHVVDDPEVGIALLDGAFDL